MRKDSYEIRYLFVCKSTSLIFSYLVIFHAMKIHKLKFVRSAFIIKSQCKFALENISY